MPKKIISAIKKGYKGKGLSEKQVNKRVYGALNNMGFMKGSKETRKGQRAERKYTKDHK